MSNYWTTALEGANWKPGTTRLDVALGIVRGLIWVGLCVSFGLPAIGWLEDNASNPESPAFAIAHALPYAAIAGAGIWAYYRAQGNQMSATEARTEGT